MHASLLLDTMVLCKNTACSFGRKKVCDTLDYIATQPPVVVELAYYLK